MGKLTLFTPEEMRARNQQARSRLRPEHEAHIAKFEALLTDVGPGWRSEITIDAAHGEALTRLMLKEAGRRRGLTVRVHVSADREHLIVMTPKLSVKNVPRSQRRRRLCLGPEHEADIAKFEALMADARPGWRSEITIDAGHGEALTRLMLKEAGRRQRLDIQFRASPESERLIAIAAHSMRFKR